MTTVLCVATLPSFDCITPLAENQIERLSSSFFGCYYTLKTQRQLPDALFSVKALEKIAFTNITLYHYFINSLDIEENRETEST